MSGSHITLLLQHQIMTKNLENGNIMTGKVTAIANSGTIKKIAN